MSETSPGEVAVTINGAQVQAHPGEMLIAAADRAGVHIPRFCYHERMSSVGMCRMCLVDVDTGRGSMLQPSCMVPVSDGMIVDTESENTRRAQEGVLELLLVNHPLDCPVCDKGGECPLQDQTMAYGPGESRFVEEKRHYEKPIPISDLVDLDRERCILCDRCTRFADEIAGDPLIQFTERGNTTQVLTFPDEPFTSYFSGNTVQICPVGALTAAPYRFKARPWDLEQVESTCTTCSLGCRVAVESSRNELVRYLGVDVESVNHGWLCDKGRFNYEAVNSDDRLVTPLVRDAENSHQLLGTNWGSALALAAEAIRQAGPEGIGIIGGSRLTNEDAYVWAKLARSVIGTDNLDAQLGDGLPAEAVLGLPPATIADACNSDTVLIIGPDLKEELAILHLRLHVAANKGQTRVIEIGPTVTGAETYAQRSIRCLPGEAAKTLLALLESDDPLASQLLEGSVVTVLGRASLAESATPALEVAAVIRDRLPHATFLPALPRGNVRGALDMGLAPGVLPGRTSLDRPTESLLDQWQTLPDKAGLDTTGMLQAAASGQLDTLILLGADPLRDFPDRNLAAEAFQRVKTIIAIDNFITDSVAQADIVMPSTAYGEQDGTTTNIEGRISRLSQKITSPGSTRDDWMIASELAWRLGGDLGVGSREEIWREIEQVAPSHQGITIERICGPEAHEGIVVKETSIEPTLVEPKEPPVVDGYGLRLVSGRKLWDAGTNTSHSASLNHLAEEAILKVHPSDLQRLGVLSGATVRVISTRATETVTAVADDQILRGTAVLPFNQPGGGANRFIDATALVNDIRIETL
ncbi:MAG: NADH-quinone oxidoreductase subunit NuoG [Acidimicrobiales bacterium]|jgi:NADH-quinone oxidoreductase subunit G|nr:NADH-quinone oxidoreductase subunit NuoG [Acidimicrobiales bacterium]|tara:strand:- start:2814 stop:5249 length:2436 start_codon:yes stop_codon:yes gene_type:complete